MGVPIITVTSDGQRLDQLAEVLEVEVRRDLNRIPEASLVLVDGDVAERRFALSDSAFFEPGKTVTVAVRDSERNEPDALLFEGLVVRHAIESSAEQSSLRVELKDAAFKLTRQRKSAVFRRQADRDAINKLIGDAALDAGELAPTPTQHDELVQFDASDWDFIVSRADAQGLVVDVHRGRVSVRAMVPSGPPKLRLEHGIDGVELSLELDAGEQWAQMTGQSWDIKEQAISKAAEADEPGVVVGNLNPAAIARKLGGEKSALVHPAIVPQGELKAWASSRLSRSRLSLLRGRAGLAGNGELAPLDVLELSGVGDRFNGRAVVSGVTNRIDQDGWRTEVRFGLSPECFARQPDIADVLAGGLLPPVQGLHVGVVAAFEADPLNEHRVKVLLSVLDEQQGPVWARVARPDAGAKRGIVFWPEPGDEVVVAFIHGDPRQAVILGSLHSSRKAAPPEAVGAPSRANSRRAIVSKGGTVIAIDDEKASVRIATPGGNQVVIDDDAKAITLADQHGNSLKLDSNGITLTSAVDFTIDAKGSVVIKGSAVDIQ